MLVSCIMPTYNRRAFVPLAIRYFLRQDYPDKELVIVDDGTDPIGDLVPSEPRVVYIRESVKRPLGVKRNLACAAARGQLIAHWDDDDWHAPWRLSYQVRRQQETGADLCGIHQCYFYAPEDGKAYEYVYPEHWQPYIVGATLLYTKAFWERYPFDPVESGEDNLFTLRPAMKKMAVLGDTRFFVSIIHGRNTTPAIARQNPSLFQPRPVADVQTILGDDWAAYEAMAEEPVDLGEAPARTGRHLDLGSGFHPRGDVNLDLSEVKLGFEPIPHPDSHFALVTAYDFLEHIPKVVWFREDGKWQVHYPHIHLLNEVWRVLEPGGVFEAHTPCLPPEVHQDPTHCSVWLPESLQYFTGGNPYARDYGFQGAFDVTHCEVKNNYLDFRLVARK